MIFEKILRTILLMIRITTKYEVREMYLESAISKINSINWNLVGKVVNEGDEDLGYEF
ncbi:hypothetical protein [Paenibacillus tyrfis]|uniref:hypothetical protein n=1 Tax=Paenibacillus tyrfis TaxID=1501230 RepID=UPI00209F4433|nr:hypothetical protein [Paenibacillus tyrfis]MCP1310157.1 hypothetical protein [Paenibacillus tyrfis]